MTCWMPSQGTLCFRTGSSLPSNRRPSISWFLRTGPPGFSRATGLCSGERWSKDSSCTGCTAVAFCLAIVDNMFFHRFSIYSARLSPGPFSRKFFVGPLASYGHAEYQNEIRCISRRHPLNFQFKDCDFTWVPQKACHAEANLRGDQKKWSSSNGIYLHDCDTLNPATFYVFWWNLRSTGSWDFKNCQKLMCAKLCSAVQCALAAWADNYAHWDHSGK